MVLLSVVVVMLAGLVGMAVVVASLSTIVRLKTGATSGAPRAETARVVVGPLSQESIAELRRARLRAFIGGAAVVAALLTAALLILVSFMPVY